MDTSNLTSIPTLQQLEAKPNWLQVGPPTIDRPFGIALWPIFAKAYSLVNGSSAESFRFRPGTTPMATALEAGIGCLIYYVVILGGRELMKSRKAFKLDTFFKIHNFYLTAISGALWLLFVEQLIPELTNNGVVHAICRYEGGWTPQLVLLYYLNYLTKYLEFIDTAFLVLRKKPLTFLHTYHHGATAALCYIQLVGHTAVSWVPIILNLGVHVVMYWYYFQAARGIKIWWKKYITKMQITQFMIDLCFVNFTTYTYIASDLNLSWLPNIGYCAGSKTAGLVGTGILSSYLVLFFFFYMSTYKKPGQKQSGDRAAKSLGKIQNEQVPDVADLKKSLAGEKAALASH